MAQPPQALRIARPGRGIAALRVRADAPGAALRRLLPGLAGGLPARIDASYKFTADQDLTTARPWRGLLGAAALSRIKSALSRKLPPGLERSLLQSYAEIGAGRYAGAARRLSRMAQSRPGDPRPALLEALALWLRGDRERTPRWLPRAFSLIEKAAALEPSACAILLDAQIRLEFEDNAGGLSAFAKLLKKRPRDLSALLGRAEAFADEKRLRPALADLDAAGAGKPSWWLSAQRGRVLGVCGKLRPALRELDAALRRRPRHGALLCWRSELLRKLGRLGESRRDLDRAIALDPSYPLSFECRGRLSLVEGDPAAALRDLDRACRLDAAHSLCLAWRAEARLKLGRLEEASEDLERVYPLELSRTWNGPAGAGARARARLYWAELEGLPSRHPRRAAAWLWRGRARALGPNWREGLSDLSRAASLGGPAQAAALAWRGFCALRAGAAQAACRDLEQACRLSPRTKRWAAWHGLALAALGREDEALSRWKSLCPDDAALADAYLERSRILEARGERALAREDARAAFVLASNRPEARERFERLRRSAE